MVVFPNCKINLGLRILEKRADGFHSLQSIFYPVKWLDALEVIAANELHWQQEGIFLGAEKNSCVKAYELLQRRFDLPPVKICLLKNIPAGAGLGGGSADAAFMLQLLNRFFNLNLTEEKLMRLAASLGSDVPFFISNRPCYVTGRGDQLQPVSLDLASYYLVVVYPQVAVNTSEAYQKLDELRNRSGPVSTGFPSLEKIQQEPPGRWRDLLFNDFEEVIFPAHPVLREVKERLYQEGALYASMSGSGSALYGLFADPVVIPFPAGWKVFSAKL